MKTRKKKTVKKKKRKKRRKRKMKNSNRGIQTQKCLTFPNKSRKASNKPLLPTISSSEYQTISPKSPQTTFVTRTD